MSSRWLGLLAVVAACGDNSDQCGPGTMNVANVCVPAPACGPGTVVDATTGQCVPDPIVCGDGTVFDPTTQMCEIDPNACKDGTVLIDGACQDPTAALVVDVEEAPEPNGYGTIESSAAPAGIVTALKPVGGSGVVIHGHLAPFRDTDGDMALDPDADTYLVDVAGPTLIRVSGIGLHGVSAGAEVAGPGRAPNRYTRFSLGLVATTSKRTLYLPAAGTYALTVADSRTLYGVLTGSGPVAADGEYFMTIDQLPVPVPTALAVTAGHATTSDMLPADGTLFYTLAMGTGFDHVTFDVPSPLVDGALAVMHGTALANLAYESGAPAATFAAGFDGVQQPLLVLEPTVAYTAQDVPFTLDVLTSDAVALPTDGSATTPTVEQRTTNAVSVADVLATSQFYFDVPQAQVVALDLAWTHPITGEVFDDQALAPVASFTSSTTAGTTWSSYHGLVLVPHPGRYYVEVFDPAGIAGTTTLGATSRIASLDATPIAIGTPADVALDDVAHAGVLAYPNVGAQPWQTFDATSTTTGGHTLAFYGQHAAARVDSLATSAGPIAGVAPLFAHAFAQTGGAFGHILLDEPVSSYLVVVRPASPSIVQSVHATVAQRVFVDLGLVVPGQLTSSTSNTVDAMNAPTLMLLHTAVGSTATLTVHPQLPATLDTRFHRIAADESAAGPIVDTSANGDDSETFVQAANGWTALIVDAIAPPANAQAFDVTVTAVGP